MTLSLLFGLVLLSVPRFASAGCIESGGNYYCDEISQVVYNNIGFSGSYNQITNMDSSSGSCSSQSKSFSGSLAPLDEEISLHVRGPVKLSHVAVYYPSSSSSKKKREVDTSSEECETPILTRHVHHHHKREPEVVYEYVTVTMQSSDGSTETSVTAVESPQHTSSSGTTNWGSQQSSSSSKSGSSSSQGQNTWTSSGSSQTSSWGQSQSSSGHTSSSTGSYPTSGSSTTSSGGSSSWGQSQSSSGSSHTSGTSTSSGTSSSSTGSSSSSGNWARSGYYEASSGTSNGLTFLNNQGGSGSGVWDSVFGNSLSYAASDGVSCASSSQVLSDITIPSNEEIIIFSGSKCGETDCGYCRPGTVAYHGFSGSAKMFILEFSMPTDTSSSYNSDMPAIWFLNAQIPRTLQYGNADCSCWTTGCGEFDAFEILDSGDSRLTSHLHTWQGTNSQSGGGGTSDYFQRPTSSSLTAAVIFDGTSISIVEIDSFDWSSSVSSSTVSGWLNSQTGTSVKIAS